MTAYRPNSSALDLRKREDLGPRKGDRAKNFPWGAALERARAYMNECERLYWLLLEFTPKQWDVLFITGTAPRDNLHPLASVFEEALVHTRANDRATAWGQELIRAVTLAQGLYREMNKGTTYRFSGQDFLLEYQFRERVEALALNGPAVAASLRDAKLAFSMLPGDECLTWATAYPAAWGFVDPPWLDLNKGDALACLVVMARRERGFEPDKSVRLLPEEARLPPKRILAPEWDFREVLLDAAWAGGVLQGAREWYDDLPWSGGGVPAEGKGMFGTEEECDYIHAMVSDGLPSDLHGKPKTIFGALSTVSPAIVAFYLALPRARRWLLVKLRESGMSPIEVNQAIASQGPDYPLRMAARAQQRGSGKSDKLVDDLHDAFHKGVDQSIQLLAKGS